MDDIFYVKNTGDPWYLESDGEFEECDICVEGLTRLTRREILYNYRHKGVSKLTDSDFYVEDDDIIRPMRLNELSARLLIRAKSGKEVTTATIIGYIANASV